MAVLFPKKVPAFSRALGEVDDCFDLEEETHLDSEVVENEFVPFTNVVKFSIIAVGPCQCDVLKSALKFSESTLLKEICVMLSGLPIAKFCAYLFGPSTVVWLCETRESDVYLGPTSWTDRLLSSFSYADSSRMFILTEQPSSSFRGPPVSTVPFTRVLRSSNSNDPCCENVTLLEQPNIISGYPAELLTRCVYRGIFACLFITYYQNVCGSSAKGDVFVTTAALLSSIEEFKPFRDLRTMVKEKQTTSCDQMYI